MDTRTVGVLMRLENVDCCKRQCGFDPYSIRHARTGNMSAVMHIRPMVRIQTMVDKWPFLVYRKHLTRNVG